MQIENYDIAYNPKTNELLIGAKVKSLHLKKFSDKISLIKQFAKSINQIFCVNLKNL